MNAKLTPSDAAQIGELIRSGNRIEAIKIYRECTGTGLAEAKEAIDHWEQPSTSARRTPDVQSVLNELQKKGKIAAIKLYRQQCTCGLKEAKDEVEKLARESGIRPRPARGCLGVIVMALFLGALIWVAMAVGW